MRGNQMRPGEFETKCEGTREIRLKLKIKEITKWKKRVKEN